MSVRTNTTGRSNRIHRRRFLKTSVTLPVAGALAGCSTIIGAPTRRGNDAPIRIGASLPFTGFLAEEGAEMYLGMEYWRMQVNNNGGLLGRPVEFVIYDDGSTQEGGMAAYQRLVDEDAIDLVMGTAGTLATAGAVKALEPREVPCVFPMAWGPLAWDIEREWCVPLLPIANEVPRGLVKVLSNLGIETFAVVRSSSGYVRDLTAGLKQFLTEAGIEILDDVIYQRNNPEERRNALQSVATLGADVIGGGGSVAEVKPLIRAVADMTIDASGFAWFDFDDTRLFPLAEAAEGMIGPGLWSARASWPGNDAFVEQFPDWAAVRRPDWSNIRLFQHHSPAAYAAASVLQRAVEDAQSVDHDAVRNELWNLEMETVCGHFSVDDQGYQVGKRMLVLQYQRHAREIVWPPDLQTSNARLPSLQHTQPS